MQFGVLLDSPAKPVARLQIAKLGSFDDARYGEFEITADNVANWQKNLAKLPGGEALVDFEHRSERKPRDSSAAGWITGIDLDGDRVMADTRWTPKGEDAIKNEIYRFVSPVFGPALGADNQPLDDALPSVALTNKPVLGMPAVCLASEERVSEAINEDPALRFHVRALDGEYGEVTQALVLLDVSQGERDKARDAGHSLADGSYPINNAKQLHAAAVLASSGHGDVKAAKKLIRRRATELGVDVSTLPGFASADADSRRAMATEIATESLLKVLDLPEGTDETKVLEALSALKETAKDAKKLEKKLEKKPVKTLEQQAKDAGLVLLDSSDVRKLQQKAAAGAEAAKQLHQQRFDTAFELALNDPKGPRVKPAEKKQLYKVYKLDADLAIDMIENREPVVGIGTQPNGRPTIDLEQDDVEPAALAAHGIFPGSHELDRKIRAHMLENKLPESQYVTVLEQVQTGAVVL